VRFNLFCTGLTDYIFRNVAWFKPTYQVSTLTDQYGPHPSRLANDGSRQTNYQVRVTGCAASEPATNPWWAVDLEVPTLIYLVNLTNRGDAYGTCLLQLNITSYQIHCDSFIIYSSLSVIIMCRQLFFLRLICERR